MEASGSGFSSTTPPVFDGENYQAWAVKMSTFMEGNDLWEAVKDDYEVTPLPDNPTINQIRFHKESITRKAKVMSCLYATMPPFIFNRIMKFPTTKDIWNFLKIEYEGDDKIRGMKALNLMREFERQQMKENEDVKDFSDRLINLANRIRVLGTEMKDDRIVQKILVSLPERFEATIASLENTKDLSDIRLAELLSALEAQEQRRLMRREVPVEAMEGALPARSQMRASGREKKSWNQQKGNAEGSSSNKGTNHPHYKCWRRPDVKCNNCHKFGHTARFCQEKDSRQDATEGAANNEVELMFTASCFATSVTRRSWLVDSGCTHHMSYDEKSFAILDQSFYAKVKIKNGDYIDVEGRGDVVVDGLKGRKLISDVLYVPKIDQNLLSVGQLVQKGYKVMFEEGLCLIADSSGKEILKIQMKNKSFSFDPVSQGQQAMAAQDNEEELWHRRLGHFHSKGIEFLQKNDMAVGFPILQQKDTSDCRTRDKLDQKAEVAIFIGYSMQSKAYRIYQPQNGKNAEGQNIEQQLSSEQNVDDTPIRGTRSLTDVYERCNVAVMEPASFEDAKEDRRRSNKFELYGFSNSDWAGSEDDMKKAEFVAATSVVNQAIWLRKLLNDMGYIMEKETKVSVDNQAALAISKNLVFHGKTKHFNVKYYYLREVQQMGEVELIYCTTEDQLADIFTKSFHQSKFVWLREKIGVSISA
ncbi:hypothetical protein ZIOFF_044618 [Zingiber officinale]|uniref:CCHC-type domain-containing protein n=1 Tax=Zingiber officinale TaxID=94328 RepID=A0A8J5FYU2_ZINOF|nr:hypothetical protein ZIOFF_044618 [Zingiber officinale]